MDETTLIQQLPGGLADVAALIDEYIRSTRLTR